MSKVYARKALGGVDLLARPVVRIVAHPKQRAVRLPDAPRPEAGARWGKPSDFGWHDRDPSYQVYFNDKELEVVGDEVYREWELVRVYAKDDQSAYAEFERTVRSFFYIGEDVNLEEVPSGKTMTRDETTTVYTYYEIAFPLHEGGEVIESGTRGEHPDDTLAKKQSEYDSTVAGGIQKAREGWEQVIAELDKFL